MSFGSRLSVDGAGPDAEESQFALSAGWGTTASLTVLDGSNDGAGKVLVTSSGSGQGQDATITYTFARPVGRAPVVLCQRSDGDDADGDIRVTDTSPTGFVITFEGLVVQAETLEIQYVVVEL